MHEFCFSHDGFEFCFIDRHPETGSADPVLLIHGFSSNYSANWVATGWVNFLLEAGYRVIAFDNRGHGKTSVSYDPSAYRPGKMAEDALALMDHLAISCAHVMGYSMGARIAGFLGLLAPSRISTLVFGGLGMGMVDGMGDWTPISAAMGTENPDQITHPYGRIFRVFADKTHSDRKALAACIQTSREVLSARQISCIMQPALVATGSEDDLSGSPSGLAGLIPHGEFFEIPGKDHMSAVGDFRFKKKVSAFYSAHPLSK